MSETKDKLESLVSLAETIGELRLKRHMAKVSLCGEFELNELRSMFAKLDLARWRLTDISLACEDVMRLAESGQRDLLVRSTVPESRPAVPRDHRSNGD